MRSNRLIFLVVFIATQFMSVLCLAQMQDGVTAVPKFALLIGNGDYDGNNEYTPSEKTPDKRHRDLRNPCNDVILIESKLLALGWEQDNIKKICDGKEVDIWNGLRDFRRNYMTADVAEGPPPIGFIYYTGHAVQVEDDTYIFAVDAVADLEEALKFYERDPFSIIFTGGVRLHNDLLNQVGSPGRGTLFVVLDACRENPIYRELEAKGLPIKGGPRPAGPRKLGLKMLFSTAEGALASDGWGGNSPFAKIFARNMMKTKTVDGLIRAVVSDVFTETSDPAKRGKLFTSIVQMPEESGTLHKTPPDVCLRKCGDL